MMKKLLIILTLLFIPCQLQAQEVLESFDNKNVSVLNDELNNSYRRIKDLEDNTATEAYVELKFDTTTGHEHDGTDSKKVLATNLDMTGITSTHVLYNNAGTLAGKVIYPWGIQSGQDLAEQTANSGGPGAYATVWTATLLTTVPHIQFFKKSGITSLYVSWDADHDNAHDNYQKVLAGGTIAGAVKTIDSAYATYTDTIDISALTDNAWYTFVIQGSCSDSAQSHHVKNVKFAVY